VLEAIQRKVDGQEITAEKAPDSGGKILDLMDALKASLASAPPAEKTEKKRRKAS
jgi:DNA end-binding protein Ku